VSLRCVDARVARSPSLFYFAPFARGIFVFSKLKLSYLLYVLALLSLPANRTSINLESSLIYISL
jgi:hypothetical protein